jgi:hypothetical protein
LQLSEEFGFQDLAAQLSQFHVSGDLKEEGTQEYWEARKRISTLEEQMEKRDKELAALRCELSRQAEVHGSVVEGLLGRVGRLEAEVTALRLTIETRTAPTLTQLQIDLQKLKDATASLPARPHPIPVPASGLPVTSVPPAAASETLRSEIGTLKAWAFGNFKRNLDSLVVEDFPEIFEDFRGERFTLLWRGSRDGFGAGDFHKRCDGHANTLVVILDTKGNIFGGFTPAKWESSMFGKDKADPSLKRFLFTLKNPHNVPARRFALKAENEDEAIFCYSVYGPHFIDILVFDNCNANTDSWTELGLNYTNGTRLDGKTVFTGSEQFQVKEIEVFEITA